MARTRQRCEVLLEDAAVGVGAAGTCAASDGRYTWGGDIGAVTAWPPPHLRTRRPRYGAQGPPRPLHAPHVADIRRRVRKPNSGNGDQGRQPAPSFAESPRGDCARLLTGAWPPCERAGSVAQEVAPTSSDAVGAARHALRVAQEGGVHRAPAAIVGAPG